LAGDVIPRVEAAHSFRRDAAVDRSRRAWQAGKPQPVRDIVRYPVLMTMEGTGGTLVQKTLRIEARIDGDGVTIGFPEGF
jgi:hypothetical protein